ncbi:hypothetical protein ACGFI9_10865 [Micromonospora sp. NPDC048930]|uniref:hypothetical protein n=1 Tax=Micromonospora sp. NPDC048930 TaxID=3364261 RepID=UPI003723F8BB
MREVWVVPPLRPGQPEQADTVHQQLRRPVRPQPGRRVPGQPAGELGGVPLCVVPPAEPRQVVAEQVDHPLVGGVRELRPRRRAGGGPP